MILKESKSFVLIFYNVNVLLSLDSKSSKNKGAAYHHQQCSEFLSSCQHLIRANYIQRVRELKKSIIQVSFQDQKIEKSIRTESGRSNGRCIGQWSFEKKGHHSFFLIKVLINVFHTTEPLWGCYKNLLCALFTILF